MRVVFHVGGYSGHPTAAQAEHAARWLPEGATHEFVEGGAAFDRLDGADLLILQGLYHTGMPASDGPYQPLSGVRRAALEAYVASGRPVMAVHGAIAGYDDWPGFAQLVGYQWVWGKSTHSPFGRQTVAVRDTAHRVMRGVEDFSIDDELYYGLVIHPEARILAVATWDGAPRPMVCALRGGAGRPAGAGRCVYLANGHDMRAFSHPMLERLWRNSVAWLTSTAA